ncbi:hypothetical protein UAY_02048 [Enterococcus moraviensis ATCC BAA-383]|uniref:DUF262 domain-containing protein n=1 Tax=Enterococcus moraviensis ATCC BAA-383 TaxID=1158609 RepID=R2SU63_9ENTE|nr:DUF262 domain-containing protein [Enterococcus moraviensis]EOH98780.1 hypothetical protein UAY_02048 [Enterococcus moraviensis ATCC BAA-383]EOT72045.1 hypothetical protein I586_01853 [Enterococcus moraviensis ATCC BAA-383]OJG68165.1 hypothetical protein RV09_GL002276 [Enterococcus moraviensis]
MKADTIKFFEFLEQKKTIFNIPVYQRNYEWSNEQCVQLFNDVEKIIQDDFSAKHFLGTIVYVDERGPKLSKYFNIIDGQQRITSFMLFMKAIADLSDDESLYDEILDDYLLNPRSEENNKIKLRSVEKDRLVFRKIIEKHEVEETSKVSENFNLFLTRIEESEYEPKEFFDALGMIEIVYIELNGNDESENPQVIFESINSTGLSLTASDLIRNFLLMGIDHETQNRLYKDYWTKIEERIPTNQISTFIRFYLTLKFGATVTERRVYEEYKRFFNNNHYTPETAIKELENYSKYYFWLNNEIIPKSTVNERIKRVNLMKATIVYPYLMQILKLGDDGIYTWDNVDEIFGTVESYLFRRSITDKRTNVLNKMFAALSREISIDNEKDRLIIELTNKKGTQIFPRDAEFVNSFQTVALYNRKNNLAKLVLMMLELYRTKEPISFESIQVEHIMPQTLTNDWKVSVKNANDVQIKYGDTIGNLTLTGYNSELSNKLFSEKSKMYQQSNITLTRELANEYDKWDAYTIEDRAKKLSEEALKIWKFPIQVQAEEQSSVSGEHFLDEDVNITGSKPKLLSIEDKDYKVDSWKKVLISFLDFVWEFDSQTFANLKRREVLKRLFSPADEVRNPGKLSNGEIVETNFSSETILSIIKIIATEYNIFDDISYTI